MPHVNLPHASITYREIGPAESDLPPVVFVHGALVDSRVWSSVPELLAERGFRCVLPDLPLGSHTTPVTDRSVLTPPGVAGLIDDFLAALNLDDVTLVGNDTGGGLCQLLVDARPERIGRLVLTNCDAFDQFPPFPFNIVFALMRSAWSTRALMAPMSMTALRHSALGYGMLARRLDPQLTASWADPVRTDTRIAGDFAALARAIGRTDLTAVAPRLRRFTKPVTVVWGQRDRVFTPELGRRVAALFDDSRLVEVEDATTFVSLDNPHSVADAIANLTHVT